MSTFKKSLPFVFLSLLLLLLAGCAEMQQNSSKNADSYTTRITHSMGYTTIKGTPKRIVLLTNESTQAALDLNVKPIGAVKSSTGNPWSDAIKDKMNGVEVVGTENKIDIEKIKSLKPDLIIGATDKQQKYYDQLEKIAPTVFSDSAKDDSKDNFILYAQSFDKEAEGTKFLKEHNKK